MPGVADSGLFRPAKLECRTTDNSRHFLVYLLLAANFSDKESEKKNGFGLGFVLAPALESAAGKSCGSFASSMKASELASGIERN
jgi:hypothetical protein